MNSTELKQKFIKFFEDRGHVRIPNASLIPENDPSALFINSGMHPLVRFLLGEPHPFGKRLVNYQRSVRTGDIEEVGEKNSRHLTFFEMLGEWSLGDYGKKESLTWTFEFLTKVLGFDPSRIYATVYKGDDVVPEDVEAIEVWKEIFKSVGINAKVGDEFQIGEDAPRIIRFGEDNFWAVGSTGPCGPTSEVFYDKGHGENVEHRFLELVNNVFMSYVITKEGKVEELTQKNIDVGWGLERLLSVINNLDENGNVLDVKSVFETDVFITERDWLISKWNKTEEEYLNENKLRKSIRVVLDHIRSSVMIISDGVQPSNKDQGYVLRRLIRRAVAFGWRFSSDSSQYLVELGEMFIEKLAKDEEYAFILNHKQDTLNTLKLEIEKFEKVLANGIKELNKVQGNIISGEIAFRLKESLGLPLEITTEIASQTGKEVDVDKYKLLMEEHRVKSRVGVDKKFVGGLGDYTPKSICYHTCAHLLLAGAKKILGPVVYQKGQNITSERLRYDLSFSGPIPVEKIKEIENWVNLQIEKDLKVDFIETTFEDAKNYGVEGMFADKYEKLKRVKIYRIYPKDAGVHESELRPEDKEKYISLEFCGGPHVKFTSEILKMGKFKIIKEESSGQGVRRIRAVLV